MGIFVAAFLAIGVREHGIASGKDKGDLDQLLSFTYAFNRKARPIIEAKLLQTSANCGRMIRLQVPPELGESAVSVDCLETDASNAVCRVICTRATSNMGNTMVQLRGDKDALRKVQDIAVVRKDAAIPKTAAAAFRDCLRIMIPEPGDPLKFHSSTITHDDRVEFWLEEPNKPSRKGERAENPGRRTNMLIRIGDLLARYCEVAPSERASIAKQVEKEAAHILSSEGRNR